MHWWMRSPPSAYATSKCRQRPSGSGARCATITRSESVTELCQCRNKSGHDNPSCSRRNTPMKKSFVRGTWQVKRAFSPCVITEGAGRTIYIAGHTGQVDDSGKSLAGDFDAQFKQTFRNI